MIKLHGVQLSPFVRKALLTMDYKGIPYESVDVFPGSDDAGFRAISPLGKVPVLEDDGFAIPDTSVICRYLDRTHPEKPIYPADPKLEAQACWLEEFADSKLIEACAGLFQQRFLFPKMMNQPTDEARVTEILDTMMPPLLDYLETQVPESGPLVGDSISIADIEGLTCFLQARYGDFEVDGSTHPRLRSYLDGAFANDVVKNRMAEEAKVIAAMIG
ncbi:MAG: glutathione S-transferase family protein [Proteobacteria bacterium]|nr:glutathione S-transferase family protein [Pseudomonadota bacterium]